MKSSKCKGKPNGWVKGKGGKGAEKGMRRKTSESLGQLRPEVWCVHVCTLLSAAIWDGNCLPTRYHKFNQLWSTALTPNLGDFDNWFIFGSCALLVKAVRPDYLRQFICHSWCRPTRFDVFFLDASCFFVSPRTSVFKRSTGWLKIKYPTRQYAISPQPVVWF